MFENSKKLVGKIFFVSMLNKEIVLCSFWSSCENTNLNF